MKKIILISFFVATALVSCEKLDNYEAPNETLTGLVIDDITKEPIVSEQPNGFRIKLSEKSWNDSPVPEYFWGKADGTFKNTKIFAGTYEVQPVEGAFFDVEPQIVEIKGTVNLEFTVTPYLSISTVNIKREKSTLEVSYTISRNKIGDKILDSRVFVSTNPNVGSNIFDSDLSPMQDFSDVDDQTVLSTTYIETITGLVADKKYYIRIGARTDNSSKRYNFTKVAIVD